MTALGDFVEALGVLRDALDVPSHRASARTSLGVLPLVALATRDALVQLIMDAGYDDVRPSHVDLLPLVTGTGARPVDVARHQGISRQAASATLQELEQLGYLDRRPDPDDQRGVVFTVTNLGLSLLEVDASGRLALGSWFKKLLTPSRYNAFRSVARNLVQALEPSRTELENLAHSLRHQLGSQGAARLAALLVQDAT